MALTFTPSIFGERNQHPHQQTFCVQRDNSSSSDIVLMALIENAEGWGLGIAPDKACSSVGVSNAISDNMYAIVFES